jgi:hypothetical protein
MTERDSTAASDRRATSVSAAVEREVRRRKRWTIFYLLLLTIPFAILARALAVGKSDRKRVDSLAVTVESVQPAIARIGALDTAARAATLILPRVRAVEESVSRIGPTVARVQELETTVSRVQRVANDRTIARLDAVDSVVPQVRATARLVQEQSARIRELGSTQEVLQRRVEVTAREAGPAADEARRASGEVLRLRQQVSAQAARLDTVQRGQTAIRERIGTLERREPRGAGPATPPATDADVLRRLRNLEAANATLRQQIERLRARPDSPGGARIERRVPAAARPPGAVNP